jgi:hypothetical protein
MKREEEYTAYMPTSGELFAAEIVKLQQNTDFQNRL